MTTLASVFASAHVPDGLAVDRHGHRMGHAPSDARLDVRAVVRMVGRDGRPVKARGEHSRSNAQPRGPLVLDDVILRPDERTRTQGRAHRAVAEIEEHAAVPESARFEIAHDVHDDAAGGARRRALLPKPTQGGRLRRRNRLGRAFPRASRNESPRTTRPARSQRRAHVTGEKRISRASSFRRAPQSRTARCGHPDRRALGDNRTAGPSMQEARSRRPRRRLRTRAACRRGNLEDAPNPRRDARVCRDVIARGRGGGGGRRVHRRGRGRRGGRRPAYRRRRCGCRGGRLEDGARRGAPSTSAWRR